MKGEIRKEFIELSLKEIVLQGGIAPSTLHAIDAIVAERTAQMNKDGGLFQQPDMASLIDHTLLHPAASLNEIERICHEALHHRFHAVCVNPVRIPACKKILDSTPVRICTVTGFPLGANTIETKVFEARNVESLGADEIDMVMNIGAMKEKNWGLVIEEIASVVNATSERIVTKVILENAYLTREEKIIGCLLARDAGADFVKTSTGFGPSGAAIEDILLMSVILGGKMGIKAAGGIRDRATALAMVRAGATRIGTSSGVRIVMQG